MRIYHYDSLLFPDALIPGGLEIAVPGKGAE